MRSSRHRLPIEISQHVLEPGPLGHELLLLGQVPDSQPRLVQRRHQLHEGLRVVGQKRMQLHQDLERPVSRQRVHGALHHLDLEALDVHTEEVQRPDPLVANEGVEAGGLHRHLAMGQRGQTAGAGRAQGRVGKVRPVAAAGQAHRHRSRVGGQRQAVGLDVGDPIELEVSTQKLVGGRNRLEGVDAPTRARARRLEQGVVAEVCPHVDDGHARLHLAPDPGGCEGLVNAAIEERLRETVVFEIEVHREAEGRDRVFQRSRAVSPAQPCQRDLGPRDPERCCAPLVAPQRPEVPGLLEGVSPNLRPPLVAPGAGCAEPRGRRRGARGPLPPREYPRRWRQRRGSSR